MNADDISEQASLLHHRIYAEHIRKDPDLLYRAVAMLEKGIAKDGGTVGHHMWPSATIADIQQPAETRR